LDAGMRVETIYVFPVSTAGVAAASLPVHGEAYSGFMSLGASGARYVAQNAFPFDGVETSSNYALSVDAPLGQAVVRQLSSAPVFPKLTHDRPVLIQLGYNHWGYAVQESDGAYGYQPTDLALPSGARIHVPTANAFRRAPARIVRSPGGDRVVLEWNAAVLECDEAQDIPGRFKLALVDVATSTVTPLGEGDGAGHAAFRANGELFVQRGRRVYQVAADRADTELPQGVLLVPPLDRDDECGF